MESVKILTCRIRVLMADKLPPVTQKQLIEDTGLNSHTIGNLYNNKFSRIDKRTIEKICTYFDCEISDLFELRN